MEKETIIAALVGVVVGYLFGKVSGREKKRIVWTEPIDFEKLDPEVTALVRNGEKIQAIKKYRELYKVGLKEAKEAVDALEERLARPRP